MNKIFKVIWNHTTQSWIVTSEISKSHGKTASSKSGGFAISHISGVRFAYTAIASTVLMMSMPAMAITGNINYSPRNNCFFDYNTQSVICGDNTTSVQDLYGNGTSTNPTRISRSIALGQGAKVGDSFSRENSTDPIMYTDAVAIGTQAAANGFQSTAIGAQSSTSRRSTAIGYDADAGGYVTTAAPDGELYGTAIGYKASAPRSHSVAIGAAATVNAFATTDTARSNAILQRIPNNGLIAGTTSASDSAGAVAIGREAKAGGYATIAQGLNANASAAFSTAIGANSIADKMETIAIGSRSEATGHRAIAIGSAFRQAEATVASGDNSIAMGAATNVSGANTTVIGSKNTPVDGKTLDASGGIVTATKGTSITATNSSIIGTLNKIAVSSVTATNPKAAAALTDVQVQGNNNTINRGHAYVFGSNNTINTNTTNMELESVVAVGYQNTVSGNNSLAVGRTNTVSGGSALAVGSNSQALGTDGIALGNKAYANTGENAVALGGLTHAGSWGTAVGARARAQGDQSIAMGANSAAKNERSFSIGSYSYSGANGGIAFGYNSLVADGAQSSTAIGAGSVVSGQYSGVWNASLSGGQPLDMLDANRSFVGGNNSYAIGNKNIIGSTSSDSFVLGNNVKLGASTASLTITNPANPSQGAPADNTAMRTNALIYTNTTPVTGAVALGSDTSVTVNNGVALGKSSVASTAAGQVGADPLSAVTDKTSAVWTSTLSAVSVGDIVNNKTRQITSVAAGTQDTDAVNVAQLKAATTHYYSVNDKGTQGGNYNNNGATGKNALAAGVSASAATENSVAVGYNAQANTNTGALAIGSNTTSSGTSSVALGTNSSATGQSAIGVGNLAKAGGQNAVAIGESANATGNGNVAIGESAGKAHSSLTQIQGNNTVLIGVQAGSESAGNQAQVAVGWQAGQNTLGAYNVASGYQAGQFVNGTNNVAFGKGAGSGTSITARLAINDTVAIGTGAKAAADNAIAIGKGAEANAANTISIGTGNIVNGEGSGAIGDPSTVNGDGSYSLGNDNTIDANNTFVIGNNVATTLENSVILGDSSSASGINTGNYTLNGTQDTNVAGKPVLANGVVSVGSAGKERQIQNVAAGVVSATSTDAINGSQLYVVAKELKDGQTHYYSVNDGGTQGGNYNNDGATGTNALAAGVGAKATKEGAIAIGTNTVSGSDNSIVLGTNAKVERDVSTSNVIIGHGAQAIASTTSTSDEGKDAVAIGYKSQVGAASNVALGSNATATGKSQAIAIGFSSNAVGYMATALGAGASVGDNGAGVAVGAASAVTGNFGVAVGNAAQATVANGVALGSGSIASVDKGAVGADPLSSATDKTTPTWTATRAAVSVGGVLTKADGSTETLTRQITSVAAGTNDTDAVNVAQLKAAGFTLAASNTGGGESTTVANDKIQNGETVTVDAGKNIKVTHTANTVSIATKDEVEFTQITLGDSTNNTVLTSTANGLDVGGDKITNVADGSVSANSKDAINGSQLHTTNQNVANNATAIANNATEIAKGLNFGANDQTATSNTAINRKLGDTIGIKGGITDTSTATSGENVITRTDANGNINIELAKNAKFDSVTTGNTLVDNSGITIKAPTGGTTTDVKLTASGLDNGGNKITNVANGDVTSTSKDAINGSQLRNTAGDIASIIGGNATVDNAGNVTASNIGGTTATTIDDAIKTVKTTVKSTDNTIKVTANTANANDGTVFDISVDSQKLAESAQLPVVYTKADGTKVYKVGNSFFDNKEGTGTAIDATDVIASMQNADGTTSTATKLANIAKGEVSSTSKDAINGSQLFAQGEGVKNIIGGSTTYDPTTGTYTNNNIGGTGKGNINDAIQTVNTKADTNATEIAKGLNFGANDQTATSNTTINRKLGDTIGIKGGITDTSTATSGENVITRTDTNGNINIELAKNAKFDSVTTGGTKLSDAGLSFVDASGSPVANSPSISKTGINAGNQAIAGVKAGTNDTDAVNVSQLKGAVDALGGGAAINTDGTIKAPTYNITNPANGTVTTANNVGDALKGLNDAVNSPLTFKGDSGEFNRNLGQTTTVKGGITDTAKLSDNNIGVVAHDGILTIKLAKDIAVDSVKAGNTTMNTYGISIANADPNKVVSLTGSGLNNGNNRITNVAAGQAGTDAVNKDQLDAAKASATTKVVEGKNVEVTEQTNADGSKTYTVATADEVEFDKVTVGGVVVDGTSNKISGLANGDVSANSTDAINGSQLFATNQNVANNAAKIADNAALIAKGINFGGTTGSNNYALGDTINVKGDSNISSETVAGGVQLKLNDVVSIGTAKPVQIDGTKGTVGGLTNTTWDANNIVSGQAATEDQLKSAVAAAQAAATTKVVEGKNVKVSEQTNADGSKTYTVATADDVSFNSVTSGTGANQVVLNDKGVNVGGNTYISDAGLNANDKKVTNVANGDVTSTSKDAINGSQLRNTADDIATIIGGNAAVDNEGNVTASNIGGTGKNNINDAIEAVNTAATKAKTTVTQGKNIVVTESKNTDGSTNYQVATADNLDVTSVKAGNTTINNAGVTVGDKVALTDSGLSAGDVKVTTDGINAGGNKITGVAAGDISATSTDAVNGSQLDAVNQRILNIITGGKDDEYYDANGNLTEAGQLALKTYNVQGQSEFVHNSVVSAIKNINEQGTKFFHTNEGQSFTSEATNSEDSSAGGKYSTAIGYQAATTAAATNGLAVGTQSKAAGENAVALGYQAQANGTNTISIGTGNVVNGNNSGAIGDPSVIDGANSYSVGNNNSIAASSDNVFILGNNVNIAANTSGAVALGNKASVTTAGSVALGEGSTAGAANIAGGTANNAYTFGAYNDANVAAKPTTSTSVVAVGSKGNERQIQHVAAGVVSATSTDAINGSQLYYTNRALGKLADVVNKNNLDLRAGIAGANAAAGLPQVYLPGKSMVAASAGTYRGQSALAVGYSRSSDNGKLVLKVQGNANTRGEVGGSVGIGYQW